MKTLIKNFTLRKYKGLGVSGKTVVAYPKGEGGGANGTTALDLGYGEYKFILDPTSNNSIISRFYEIYITGTSYQVDVDLGTWEWYVDDLEVDAEESFLFADLLDENGEALPTTLSDVHISLTPLKGRFGHISAKSDTEFTITLASEGGDEEGKFNVHIKVKK